MFSRRSFVFVGLAGACARHACAQQPTDGDHSEPITEPDIQKRLRLDQHRAPSREAVIEELRQERRILQEAKSRGIEIADPDLDAEFAETARRLHLTVQQFYDELAKSGVDLEDAKQRRRAELARKALGLPP